MSSGPAAHHWEQDREGGDTPAGEVLRTHPQARVILDEIGPAARGTESSVDALQERFKERKVQLTRREIVEVFKALDAAGAGRFIVGRRTRPSRFRWKADWNPPAEEASGLINTGGIDSSAAGPGNERPGEATTLIDHRYRLRPNYQVVFTLPADLTTSEANRLADFVRTLPFE